MILMKKLFYYLQHNLKIVTGKNNNKRKHKKEKQLSRNINFKLVLSNFALFYFVYISFVLALLSSSPNEVTGYDYLPVFFPLPFFLLITAILIEIDNKRTVTNFELQAEIKRVKFLYDVRKKTEEIFDGN